MKHKIVIEFETDALSQEQIDYVSEVSRDCFTQIESLTDNFKEGEQYCIHYKNSKLDYSNDLIEKVDEAILEDEGPKIPAEIRAKMVDIIARADADVQQETSWRDRYHDAVNTFESCDDEELIENFEGYVDMDNEDNIKLLASARLDQIVESVVLAGVDNE